MSMRPARLTPPRPSRTIRGMQPPHGPWGPQPPQSPSPQFPHAHMNQAPGWGVHPDPQHSWAVGRLDQELQNWLIICGVGWFAGFMFLVGPAAWWKANDLRDKYLRLGAPIPGNVGVLRLVGILTCAFCVLLAMAVVFFLVFGFAYVQRHHGLRF